MTEPLIQSLVSEMEPSPSPAPVRSSASLGDLPLPQSLPVVQTPVTPIATSPPLPPPSLLRVLQTRIAVKYEMIQSLSLSVGTVPGALIEIIVMESLGKEKVDKAAK